MVQKSAISILQECMAEKHLELPNYSFKEVGTLLDPSFVCIVTVGHVTTEAIARNKKLAKERAASDALRKMGLSEDIADGFNIEAVHKPIMQDIQSETKTTDYVSKLNLFASGNQFQYASFDSSPMPKNGEFVVTCSMLNYYSEGRGPNKKSAKQIAAKEMLNKLEFFKPSTETDIFKVKTKVLDIGILPKEIEDKFKQLSLSNSGPCTSEVENKAPIPDIDDSVHALDDLKSELEKYNIQYRLQIMQKDPYIIILILPDSKMTLMGSGSTKEQATIQAILSTLKYLKKGCNMSYVNN